MSNFITTTVLKTAAVPQTLTTSYVLLGAMVVNPSGEQGIGRLHYTAGDETSLKLVIRYPKSNGGTQKFKDPAWNDIGGGVFQFNETEYELLAASAGDFDLPFLPIGRRFVEIYVKATGAPVTPGSVYGEVEFYHA